MRVTKVTNGYVGLMGLIDYLRCRMNPNATMTMADIRNNIMKPMIIVILAVEYHEGREVTIKHSVNEFAVNVTITSLNIRHDCDWL